MKRYQSGEIGSRTEKLQAKNKTQGGKHPRPVPIGLSKKFSTALCISLCQTAVKHL